MRSEVASSAAYRHYKIENVKSSSFFRNNAVSDGYIVHTSMAISSPSQKPSPAIWSAFSEQRRASSAPSFPE